jgi:hypothetical protein
VPDGKVLIPGVVSHATNVVEHPEVVADRILNFARVVGRENAIASTDCGLGGRIHPQLVWAKLAALSRAQSLRPRSYTGLSPPRIASLVLFLLSDESGYMVVPAAKTRLRQTSRLIGVSKGPNSGKIE